MAKRNPPNPTLSELEAQRQDLAGRLAAVGKQLQRLDAVADWELCSRALGEQAALERAVQALDERIAAARLAERQAQREQQDAAQHQRAVAARANLDAAARRYVDALLALPLAELAAAQQELVSCGGWPGNAAGVAIVAAGAVDAHLQRLRLVAPTWLGLPEPPSKEALFLAERQAAVAAAEARLEQYRKMRANARHNEPSPDAALLRTMAYGLVGARQSLLRLTEPDADEVTVMNKSYAGINELAEALGSWHERRIDAERKAQREQRAQQNPLLV